MSDTFQQENKFILKDTVTREGSNQSDHWGKTQDEANNKDPKALAIMDLKDLQRQVDEEIKSLNEFSIRFKNDLVSSKSNLIEAKAIMAGVVIVTVLAFLIGSYQINSDRIGEKELYLKYSDLQQSYFDKNIELKDLINKQNIEIINLKNQIDLLKAKNPNLK